MKMRSAIIAAVALAGIATTAFARPPYHHRHHPHHRYGHHHR